MSAHEVDEYLQGVQEPKRSTLETLRRTILEVVSDAGQLVKKLIAARLDETSRRSS